MAEIFVMSLPEKIADLQANFGTAAPVTRTYERIYELTGDKPTLDQLEAAIALVSEEVADGKFKPQS
jgi:hypothetical protein